MHGLEFMQDSRAPFSFPPPRHRFHTCQFPLPPPSIHYHPRQLDDKWLVPAEIVRHNINFTSKRLRRDATAVPIVVSFVAADCPGDIGPVEMPGKLNVTQQELLGEEGGPGQEGSGKGGRCRTWLLAGLFSIGLLLSSNVAFTHAPLSHPLHPCSDLKPFLEWFRSEANDKVYGATDKVYRSIFREGRTYTSDAMQSTPRPLRPLFDFFASTTATARHLACAAPHT